MMNMEIKSVFSAEEFVSLCGSLQETQRLLHKSLERLHPQEKLILHLRFWDLQSISEIAKLIGNSWEEVDGKIHRILNFLKRELQSTAKQDPVYVR